MYCSHRITRIPNFVLSRSISILDNQTSHEIHYFIPSRLVFMYLALEIELSGFCGEKEQWVNVISIWVPFSKSQLVFQPPLASYITHWTLWCKSIVQWPSRQKLPLRPSGASSSNAPTMPPPPIAKWLLICTSLHRHSSIHSAGYHYLYIWPD